ncbi:unnamed protein product [Vitrella brassicaformis CCMP3155]|uniref:PPIase cyclophilin-type domain-containing protein n=1 Tax=Vitrella brassicaformis (strain CCMP3155) TaxID=1169540 RepID=A0A0G4EWJ5_VITBC|nr:unnamed protein product [Vitrella brassicaformis CCMP3155]|eukprot:CEM02628.1 unnamed protein product [Vitrella brassicaformis CCMP3155]
MSVTIKTNLGDLKVELFCHQAPKCCKNFLALAASGYYNGTKFHRNIKGFMIQGGDPTGTGKGGASIYPNKYFEDEFVATLKPLPAIEDIHDDNNEPHQHQETNDAQDDMTIIEEDGNGQQGEEDTDEQQTRTTRTTDERRIPGRVYKDHFFDHPDLLFVNEDGEMTEDPSEDDKTADDPSLPQLFQPTIPKTYNQAIKSAAADQWKEAMDREMKSIEDLGVFEYVPTNAATTKIISCRWVFALKPDKYKARIVARGFEQDGNQVDDVFPPTPSYHIVRSAFALANQLNLEIHQMDINTAFLNAPLDKPVFMRCPPGYEKPGHVVRLRKALYGLKEAPRAWNITLHNQLLDRGFVRHPQEPCVYLHKDNNILLVVFVNDILIVSEQEGVTWFKQQLSSVFATKDLGEVDIFLGLKIIRDRQERTLQITQPQYIDKMLKRFSMENANPVDFPCASGIQLTSEMSPKTDEEKTKMKKVPYRQLVGALMFCSVTCCSDIAYVVKALARYAHEPDIAASFRRDRCLQPVGSQLRVSGRPRTTLGNDKRAVELFCHQAPKCCKNFLALAASGYYNGTKFHRNIKGFMIQGGDPTGTGKGGASIYPNKYFEDEFVATLKHDRRGIVSMANLGRPSTNGSQFFITHSRQPHLNGVYSVFGRLIDGLDTLDKMEKEPTDPDTHRPQRPIVIEEMIIHANPIADEEQP